MGLKFDFWGKNSKCCTWNVRSLFRALDLVTSEIEKYRMDLLGVQEVRWEGNGILESRNYTLFYGENNANHQLGHTRIRSAVKRERFISDHVSYITQKGRWYNIIINVHVL